MSKVVESKLATIALNCSVKVSGTLYAPDDVIEVTEDIARRLIEQKAADPWRQEVETAPEADVEEIEEPETDETPAKGGKDSKMKGGKPSPVDDEEDLA